MGYVSEIQPRVRKHIRCAGDCDNITLVSTSWIETEVAAAIHESASPALAVVFEGIELSRIELDRLISDNESFTDMGRPEWAHHYVSTGRYLLRRHIAKNESAMGDWKLNEQVATNGAILLHNGLQHIRLAHHRNPATIPHAGTNLARVEYFENTQRAMEPALLEEEQRMLLLWQIWNARSSRLVHTLSKGSYRRSPAVDMDIIVHREEDDFTSYSFPGDLDQPLFELELDEPGLTGTQE